MKKFARLGLSLLLVSVSLYAYAALVVSAATDPADEAMTQIRPEAIRADMRFFADDLLEGRGVERRDPGAENKPVTGRTFITFRGPEGPTPKGSATDMLHLNHRATPRLQPVDFGTGELYRLADKPGPVRCLVKSVRTTNRYRNC